MTEVPKLRMPILPPGLRLVDALSIDQLDEVYRLRVQAWRARTGLFPSDLELWTDEFDQRAHHFAILDDGRPVAAARVTIHADTAEAPDGEVYGELSETEAPAPVAAFSRLVVSPLYAKAGLSHCLDEARLDLARREGCKTVIGHTVAGPSRIVQLQALGFRVRYRAKLQPRGGLAGTGRPLVLVLDLQGGGSVGDRESPESL